MGDTLDALGYKANVPARTKGWVARKKDAVVNVGGSMLASASGATDSVVTKVSGATPGTADLQAGAGRLKDTAQRNPLGLALAGTALGFVAGLFAPSTRVEDEKSGRLQTTSNRVPSRQGQEAIQHGKDVAQAAAQSAVETAKGEGREHGEEMASSLQDKARDVAPAHSR